MAKIDRLYIATALLLLVIGMALGFYMGAAGDSTVRDTHVAILLPGFVTLAVYGVIYRLWPAMKESASGYPSGLRGKTWPFLRSAGPTVASRR